MLPRSNRLTKKNDFAIVQRDGMAAGSDFLVLKFLKNSLATTRVGFVVSKKISNKAVIRNKVKRRLREAMRLFVVDAAKGWDLIFFTKSAIKNKDFEEIKVAVESLLRKAKLISK